MMSHQTLQTGYVTDDLDRACARFTERCGITEFYRPPLNEGANDAGQMMRMQMAHAWWGNAWLEIIQPVDGWVDIYRDWLPPGGGVRFHHFAMMMDSPETYQRAKSESIAAGREISFSMTHASGISLFYLDTVAELGHYLEYLYFPDLSVSPLMRMRA